MMKTIEEIKTLVRQRDKINDELDKFIEGNKSGLKRYLQGQRVGYYDLTIQTVESNHITFEGHDYDGEPDTWSIPIELFTDAEAFFLKEEERKIEQAKVRQQQQIDRQKARAASLRREWERVEAEISTLEKSVS